VFFFLVFFMILRVTLSLLLVLSPGLLACKQYSRSTTQAAVSNLVLKKINFDLSQISSDGLIGPPDGLRSLSYEFCIPATEQHLNEVRSINPAIQISRSPGRIRCTKDQYLCIGETHTPQWRETLMAIAKLDYVQRIDQFFGE
jgi:hypothetical protein